MTRFFVEILHVLVIIFSILIVIFFVYAFGNEQAIFMIKNFLGLYGYSPEKLQVIGGIIGLIIGVLIVVVAFGSLLVNLETNKNVRRIIKAMEGKDRNKIDPKV